MGVKYWTFHDRDIAPEGATIAETNANLDAMAALAKELMAQTGIKLLWGTANLFSHPRYMNGTGLCVGRSMCVLFVCMSCREGGTEHACLVSVHVCVCMYLRSLLDFFESNDWNNLT